MKTYLWAIPLVIISTFLSTTAEVNYKLASSSFEFSAAGLIFNLPLIIGIIAYLVAAVFLIIAFSGGELSIIDPLQSFSFIWTVLAAWLILKEQIMLSNVIGVVIIFSGIMLLTTKARESK